jgi:glucose/arabinose dehydrogenase
MAAVLVAIVFVFAMPAGCFENVPPPLGTPDAGARFEARPSNLTCLAPPLAVGRVRLEPTYEGFVNPMVMQHRADRGVVYVGEVAGRIKVYDLKTKQITTALDVSAAVSHQHEGLFGFVTHPTKPYAYLTVERDLDPVTARANPNRSEIIRFRSNDGGRTYDRASETLILRIDRPRVLHPAGTLRFGKDGLLYIGVGEVGLPYSTSTLFGSILRIDVDGGSPYAIP